MGKTGNRLANKWVVWSGEQQRRMFQAKEQQVQMPEAGRGLRCPGRRPRARKAPGGGGEQRRLLHLQPVPWVLRLACELLM